MGPVGVNRGMEKIYVLRGRRSLDGRKMLTVDSYIFTSGDEIGWACRVVRAVGAV